MGRRGAGISITRPPLRPRPVDTRERHLIADVRYRDEWILCTCGAVVTAEPDALERDRHEPFAEAWADHRARAVGAP